MIERNHLEILLGIQNHGSLTAAADALNLTQSALSHSIKKLEQITEVKLWHKSGRKLQLTQAGEYLLTFANRIIPQFEHADTVLQRFSRGEKGHLRIGMECHPCYRWLLHVVTPYLQQWQEVDIDVKQSFQFGGMAALFNYDIDILVTPDPLFTKGVSFKPVFNYEQVLVVSKQHSLAQKAYVRPKDLQQETLFTYPVDSSRLDIFVDFLSPANCLPKQHKTLEATEMILQMVAAQRGVTALPRWLVTEYTESMNLQVVQLGERPVGKTIHLGIRDNEPTAGYLTAFLALAKQQGHSMETSLGE